MKKLIVLSCLILLFVNCSKESKKEEKSNSITDALGGIKELNKLSDSLDNITKKTEKLKTLIPLTNEELKAVIPESVLGLKRTSLSVGEKSLMKISSAEAEYGNEDNSKNVKINILDGAGDSGSAMIGMMMMGLTSTSEKITPNSFEKLGEFNGVKAKVEETKSDSEVTAEITYLIKERYMISIESEGFTADELQAVMDAINVAILK